MNNLAMVLRARGKLDEAEPLFRKVMDPLRRVLGTEHPDNAGLDEQPGHAAPGSGQAGRGRAALCAR